MAELDCWHTDLIICPYCGYKEQGSWEYTDSGIVSCKSCGKEFGMERDVHVYYSTYKLKRDVK